MPARDLYVSERFVKAKAVAEKLSDAWFVLSALHGLLPSDKVVENYDLGLHSLSSEQKSNWTSSVRGSMKDMFTKEDRITFLCSDAYTDDLVSKDLSKEFVIRLPLLHKSKSKQIELLLGMTGQSQSAKDLDRFYDILFQEKAVVINGSEFGTPAFATKIPSRGVYFFFEPTQKRFLRCFQSRVVRVGTHGVSSGSKSSLLDRINTHFGTKTGGGNHRSSVMRLHIGAAMLASGTLDFSVPSWGTNNSLDGKSLDLEKRLESEVSRFLSKMQIICISVADKSSAKSDRAYIEQNSIGLLSGKNGPIDVADSAWLGSVSPKDEIRTSSLWNVNCVHETYDPDFLDVLERYMSITLEHVDPPADSIAPEYWYDQRRGRESKGQLRLF